jgi:replicative DNA helicase
VLQQVPFNEDFEKAVIVSILQDPNLFPKISAIIQTEDFFKERHKEIYKAISSIEVDNIDSLTVEDKLRPETATYFKELVQDADRILPTTSNALFYAETVKHKSKLRAGIELGQQIIATCYQEQDADEAIQTLEDMFALFLQKRVLEDKSESSSEAFRKFIELLQTREPEDPSSIKTGFAELDLMTQRMEGLIVLGARPGMGKTAFAANIALNVLKKDHSVLFFSLEQGEDQIFERMLAAEAEVPLEEIRLGVFRNDEVATAHIENAEHRLGFLVQKMHLDDRAGVPTSYITSVARQKKYEWGSIGLIVVDYLHLLQLHGDNKVDALGDATKELRALGKELGCPVLLLSQLNRSVEGKDAKKNRRPDLSDLRSSGEIEQSADMVWFLYRDSYYEQAGLAPDDDIIEVLVRKSRNGRQGIVNLEWHRAIMKFKDVLRLNPRAKR